MIVLLPFLFGCTNNRGVPPPIPIEVSIRYVDTEYNLVLKEPENNDELTGKTPFEILSVTDEKGDSVVFRTPISYTYLVIGIDRLFRYDTPDRVREYNIKYKVPSILGESIEEVRMIYNVNTRGYTNVWYNNKEMALDGALASAVLSDYPERYNGDTIVYFFDASLTLVLPVKTVK